MQRPSQWIAAMILVGVQFTAAQLVRLLLQRAGIRRRGASFQRSGSTPFVNFMWTFR